MVPLAKRFSPKKLPVMTNKLLSERDKISLNKQSTSEKNLLTASVDTNCNNPSISNDLFQISDVISYFLLNLVSPPYPIYQGFGQI